MPLTPQFHTNNHSLKAVPHGYFLSPSGLTSVMSQRSARPPAGPDGIGCDSGERPGLRALPHGRGSASGLGLAPADGGHGVVPSRRPRIACSLNGLRSRATISMALRQRGTIYVPEGKCGQSFPAINPFHRVPVRGFRAKGYEPVFYWIDGGGRRGVFI